MLENIYRPDKVRPRQLFKFLASFSMPSSQVTFGSKEVQLLYHSRECGGRRSAKD